MAIGKNIRLDLGGCKPLECAFGSRVLCWRLPIGWLAYVAS
jgi:hypothetical protein